MTERTMLCEWIEREAWADLLEGAKPETKRALGLRVERISGTTALMATQAKSILLNRVLGLGVFEPAESQGVDQLLQAYRNAEIDRFFVHLAADAQPAELCHWLGRHDVVRYPRAWVKLARGRTAKVTGAIAKSELAVQVASERTADAIGAILELGFDMPGGAGQVFADAVGRDGWHAYIASEGSVPVAAALMFVRDGIANLAGAATLPSHRGRGAQAVLMQRRIQDALDLGSSLIVAETGEEVADDLQHSYRNMGRFGLKPICTRDNYAPEGTQWHHRKKAVA